MKIADVRAMLPYWQEVLNLPQWSISVNWAVQKDLGHEDNVGNCWWFTEEQRAEITMLRKQEDYESTLVHELVHLTLEGHLEPEYRGNDRFYEQGINNITRGLLRKGRSNGRGAVVPDTEAAGV